MHVYPIHGHSSVSAKTWVAAEEEGIANNPHFHETVAKLVESIPEGRIMILVRRITHGDRLHALLPGAYWIKGNDDIETR